jgi:uncharacterized membrane protein required for colicin V production
MFMDFLKSINWLDILMLALAIRIIYVAMNAGFVVELLTLLGLVVTLFLCMHYYVLLGGLISQINAPQWAIYTGIFILMWVGLEFLCRLIREGLLGLFSIQTASGIDKWGGILMGVLRFIVTGSLVIFLLLLTTQKYLQTSVVKSFSAKYLVQVAPGVYGAICDGVVVRLIPGQHENRAVAETIKDVAK